MARTQTMRNFLCCKGAFNLEKTRKEMQENQGLFYKNLDNPLPNLCPLCNEILQKRDLETVFEVEIPTTQFTKALSNFEHQLTELSCCKTVR